MLETHPDLLELLAGDAYRCAKPSAYASTCKEGATWVFDCHDCRSDSNTIGDSEDFEDNGSSEEAEQIDTDEDADADAEDDADDFQQPVRRRSAKSAYEVGVSDSEHASDSESSPAKARGSHRLQKGNSSKAKAAAPVRRQPSRTAAVKASLAEPISDSDQDTSSVEPEKGSNRKRTGLSSGQAEVKRQKAVVEDSDCSMKGDDSLDKELGLVSGSEAGSEEDSDKENQPAPLEAAAVRYKLQSSQTSRRHQQ